MSFFSKKDKISEIFNDIPMLEGGRIRLRKILPTDADDMFEYASRPDVTEFLLWNPHESSVYTSQYLAYVQRQYKSGQFFDWAVELKKSGKMIGTCGFVSIDMSNRKAEIGYVINPNYRGQGYADEALGLVMRFGFEKLGLNRIETRYMVGNDASRRVMEKCGMTFEGIFRSALFVKEKYRDIGEYAILKSEFFGRSDDKIKESE